MGKSMARVAITGLGCVTALGNDLASTWSHLVEGKSGIRTIEGLDLEKIPVHIAGTVRDFSVDEDILLPKESTRYDVFAQYSLQATKEAFLDAGIDRENYPYDPSRMGTLIGVGIGGFPYIEKQIETFLSKGHRRTSPFFIPSIISNMAPGLISIKFGLKGLNYTVTSACASGSHAISSACTEIMTGRQDLVVSGGSEGTICYQTLSGFAAMKALSKRNDEPEKASRPFDKDRDGFVVGEGAGVLILENYDKAVARGARIYGEIVGHGANSDAFHITAPLEDGSGASACMKMAIEDAGIKPEQIGYVNAHGTSTPLGDIAETKAIKRTFGDHARHLMVSSTKSMTGHLLGAAGGVESLFCAKALHEGLFPPTINLDNQDPECDLDYIPHQSRKKEVEYVLNNSFGFGGTNSSLIIKKAT